MFTLKSNCFRLGPQRIPDQCFGTGANPHLPNMRYPSTEQGRCQNRGLVLKMGTIMCLVLYRIIPKLGFLNLLERHAGYVTVTYGQAFLGHCCLRGSHHHGITACMVLPMHLSRISTNWIGNEEPKQRHNEPLAKRTGIAAEQHHLPLLHFSLHLQIPGAADLCIESASRLPFASPPGLSRGPCHPPAQPWLPKGTCWWKYSLRGANCQVQPPSTGTRPR